MELQTEQEIRVNNNTVITIPSKKISPLSFITANSESVSLDHLQTSCTIPVFSRDNESTISHQEFVEVVLDAVSQAFPMEIITGPEVRVSHVIKGRVPEAIGKPAKELREYEKTIYYERMAFMFELSSISKEVNGNKLSLSVGGVRAYNHENLYGRKMMEKFKVFIGFKNLVCCNLCVSTDGYQSEIKASSPVELNGKVFQLFHDYDPSNHLAHLNNLGNYKLTEKQFAMFLGRARLYNYLPKDQKANIPLLGMNDGQIGAVARSYYDDENFSIKDGGSLSLWKLYNLFTGAVKSSYIDHFLDRNVNAYQLTEGICKALDGDNKYKWFLE
jgi:hypothetical protein